MLEACEYCDDRRNREEIVELLCRPEYVGSAPEYTRPGFLDAYDRGDGTEPEQMYSFNQFYVNKTNYPDRAERLWMMTQLTRWGLAPFPKNWQEILDRVCRADVFGEAARELGFLDTGRDPRTMIFDEIVFDPEDPIKYLNSLEIKQPVRIQEICLI